MSKILIFAGTIEGRELAISLDQEGHHVHVCVATEYGEILMPQGNYITVTAKRLVQREMEQMILSKQIEKVIDATHPYAVEVSQNVKAASEAVCIPYLRLIRETKEVMGADMVTVENIEQAVAYLKSTTGNILVTTGSKELEVYTHLKDYRNRIFARVLSTVEVANHCKKLGFEGRNLICMQGPFSEELNYAMLKQLDACYLVTKECGNAGGFPEKIEAAKRAGATIILIKRPVEEAGVSFEEVVKECKNVQTEVRKRTISFVGIGMGAYANMTLEAISACKEADILIGAGRILETLQSFDKPLWEEYNADKINTYIKEHSEYSKIVVALSGDIGFYSGAKKLRDILDKDLFSIQMYCGISSVVYFCAQIGIPWEQVKLVSNHGRIENFIGSVKHFQYVFVLVGGVDGISNLCQQLTAYGLENVYIWVGQDLSYETQRIEGGSPKEINEMHLQGLQVCLIENKNAKQTVVTHGIADSEFIRGKVPMTKEEVRSISLSKLRLTSQSIVYDIGAGTGSVAIECALQAINGQVYAIEKKQEAVDLIEQNKYKFGAFSLEVIKGLAPEVLVPLPKPTHAFIGGSSGNLAECIALLQKKNPSIRIVINAIALETIADVMQIISNNQLVDLDIVQIAIGKSKTLGNYHMMMGLNPVLIVSFGGEE